MITYIINSVLCLTVLMLFYQSVLAEQKMNQLKRFYLLGSLIIAALIPFISITYPPTVSSTSLIYSVSNSIPTIKLSDQTERSRDILPIVIWSLYLIGSLICGVRLGVNLFSLRNKIQNGQKIKNLTHTLILTEGKEIPHTFLNYIFVSKKAYLNKLIPAEIFIHEEAHVQQKHTFDILFVEILCVVFWFNPLLYWVKREMKLNHEYLADQVVLKRSIDPVRYQQLLISFPGNFNKNSVVSPFHFVFTKKRIMMMFQEFSIKKTFFRLFMLVPVLAICTLIFSNRTFAKSLLIEDVGSINDSIPDKIIALKVHGESIIVNERITNLNGLVETLNATTSNWDRDDFSLHRVNIEIGEDVPNELITKINQEIRKTELAKEADISSPYIPTSNQKSFQIETFLVDRSKIFLEGQSITAKKARELLNTRRKELKVSVSENGENPAVVHINFRR